MKLPFPSSKNIIVTGVLGSALCWCQLAAGPDLRPRPRNDRYPRRTRDEAPTRIIAERDGIVITSLSEKQRREASWVIQTRSRAGEGGGASVAGLVLIQTHFLDTACGFPASCAEPCNAIQALWTESFPNPGGVDLYIHDTHHGTIPDGQGGASLSGLSAGEYTLRIESKDDASSDEKTITVLDNQPFADAQNVQCAEGELDGEGSCQIVATLENPGPTPDYYRVLVNGMATSQAAGEAESFSIPENPPGEYCIALLGFKAATPDSQDVLYRGCLVETESCCTLVCEGAVCNPPVDFFVCQIAYGASEAENGIFGAWTNGDTYEGINVLLDGELSGALNGNAGDFALVGGLSPGEHTFGVQGNCGDKDGLSTETEASIELLTETPHPNPVDGAVACVWTEGEGGTTTATWTNADPSLLIDVYLITARGSSYVGVLPGGSETVTLGPTQPTDMIALQFFASVDGSCYGSNVIVCSSGSEDRYIPAACDGTDVLTITSAIRLLNFLFLGGPKPPCLVACDCNGDGKADISDASCILNFLFLGSGPPTGWTGNTPTCVAVRDGDDCETPNANCPLEE